MQIGITNPLREFLKWRPFPANGDVPPIFCWDAHRVKVDGRVMLVVCNAANRFAGVTAMRAADWRRLDEVSRDLVAASMLECGFTASAVDEYLERAGAVEFGRTHGRSAVGCMNRMIDVLTWMQCDRDAQFQAYLTHYLNVDYIGSCATRKGLGWAADRMAEDLLEIGIDPHEGARRVIDLSGAFGAGSQPGPQPQAGRPADEELMRELDDIIAEIDAELDGGAAEAQGIAARIEAATRAMRAERGHDSAKPPAAEALCTVCGAEPRVFLGGVPYCLACYNEMTERLMGAQHVTNDSTVLAAFDARGGLVQFAVERMITPPFARWTAHEAVGADDPRGEGYEGVEVCVDADVDEPQDETLSRLWEKAQRAVSRPSSTAHVSPDGFGVPSNGAHVGGEVRFAEDSGWARIGDDEHGNRFTVLRRY